MQFAYSTNRSTEDTILTLLHHANKHLVKPKSYVRLLFLDFSSTFNTILLHFMLKKLIQCMRISNSTSEVPMKSGQTLVPHNVVCYHLHCLPSTNWIAIAASRGYK